MFGGLGLRMNQLPRERSFVFPRFNDAPVSLRLLHAWQVPQVQTHDDAAGR